MEIRLFLFILYTVLCNKWTFALGERPKYKNFIVVSSSGNDSESCLNGTSPNLALLTPCETLDYVFKAISNETRNATEVILEPGIYNLTKNASFEGIFDLGITGNGSSLDTKVSCSLDIGLTFIRSGNIQLQNFTISSCGALHHSTIGSAFEPQHKNHSLFYSGMFMAYCENVTILNTRISESRGIGLVMYDVGGTVVITKTHFTDNTPVINESYAREHNYAFAGGGVYVELTYDGSLPPFNFLDPERFHYQHNDYYLFDSCNFEGNRAPKQYFNGTLIEFPHGMDHMPFGRGGGVSIYVKGKATNNAFMVHECQFLNNTALWGAGLFFEFQDKTEGNSLNISSSNFRNNFAHIAGGGVRSGIPIWGENLVANNISYWNNIFENNTAIFGAGASYYGPFNTPLHEKQLREVKFLGCTWKNNKATLGAALGLSTAILDLTIRSIDLSPVLPYQVVLENAAISGNRIILTEDKRVVGQGAVYSSGVPIVFRGNTVFEDNSKTALVLDSAYMKAHDNLTFIKNKGIYGGALGVYGMSLIDLMPLSKLNFTQNHASEKGGAIYVAGNGPPILEFETTELNLHSCFLSYNNGTAVVSDYEKWNVEIIFDSNTAKKGGGNSIYAYSLQPCRKPGDKRVSNETMQWKFIKFKGNNVSIGDEISTEPIKIVTKRKEWNVSPGESFQVTIELYDEKDSPVQGIVSLLLHSEPDSPPKNLTVFPRLLLIDPHENTKKYSNLTITGHSCTFNLTLMTLGGQTLTSKLTNLNLKTCPRGFRHEGVRCACMKDLDGVSHCTEGKNVYLMSGYWGGLVDNRGQFVTYPCPPGYCNTDVTTLTKEGDFLLNPHTGLCAENRKQNSTLCGECKHGCSVLIGSEKCGNATTGCSVTTLYWFVPLFCVSAAISVFIVLALDLDIFTVYLNAWLYSYQILPYLVNEDNETFPDDKFLTFFIGLANFKIRISKLSLCVQGLTGLQKLYLEYSFPAYIFIVLFVLRYTRIVPWVCRRCNRLRCLNITNANDNVTHALCNLLVLLYTAIILTSFKIIHYVHLSDTWVLYYDGSSFDKGGWKTHLGFSFVIILLILALVLAILLLCIPQVFYCVSRYRWYDRIRIFFDLFQSCFHDQDKQRNHRWFAGFYFLCRFGIYLMAFFVPFGPLRRSILEASCVLIAGVFLFIQPYNTQYWWLNISDGVLLLNLCLVAIFSTAITHDHKKLNTSFRNIVHVLAYVPLIYFVILVGITGWICYQRRGDGSRYTQQRNEQDTSSGTPEASPVST